MWCGTPRLTPHRPPHGRSPWGLFLSQSPAHTGELFSSLPHLCSHPDLSQNHWVSSGLSLPRIPSQSGNTHTRDVSLALDGQLSKPGPTHWSNNWEWAVAPAFLSLAQFTPTMVSWWKGSHRPAANGQGSDQCLAAGRFAYRLRSCRGPISLSIPRPVLGAFCPCSFSLHKNPEGKVGRVPS